MVQPQEDSGWFLTKVTSPHLRTQRSHYLVLTRSCCKLTSTQNLPTDVYSSFIHDGQTWTHPDARPWVMDKLVHPGDGLLFSEKEK